MTFSRFADGMGIVTSEGRRFVLVAPRWYRVDRWAWYLVQCARGRGRGRMRIAEGGDFRVVEGWP